MKDFLEKSSEPGPDHPNQIVYNYLTPARHERNEIKGQSKTPVDLTPDSFKGQSIAHMQDIVRGLKDHPESKRLNHEQFVLVDEQGLKTETAVIYYYHTPPLDPELEPNDPRQKEENIEPDGIIEPHWLSWRVKWKDVSSMTANIAESPAMLYEVFIPNRERFINEQGVFDLDAAIGAPGGG